MKQLIFTAFFTLLFAINLSSQNDYTLEQSLYQGTIDGKLKVTMFLSVEDPCGGNPYTTGMYKYDEEEEWIELSIAYNEEEERYCMTEYLFTGVLILKKENNTLVGTWISPDTQRQLPIRLQEQPLSNQQKTELSEIMEEIFYNHNDC